MYIYDCLVCIFLFYSSCVWVRAKFGCNSSFGLIMEMSTGISDY